MKNFSQKNNYTAWNVSKKDFPARETIENKISFFIRYGILAPSTHNTQPWLFEINDNKLAIKVNKQVQLPESDPTGRNQAISIGACVMNIKIAADKFGYSATEEIRSDIHQVDLTFKKSDQKTFYQNLFAAINKRYSEKNEDIVNVELNSQQVDEILELSENNILLSAVKGIDKRREISKLHFEAAKSFAYPAFGKELASWMRVNNTNQFDGMVGRPSGLSSIKIAVGKFLMNFTPKFIEIAAKKYKKLILNSSGLFLLSSKTESFHDQVNVGQNFQIISLFLTTKGLSATPLAATIESETYRQQLSNYFTYEKTYLPQLMFRVGKMRKGFIHTPRRPELRINTKNNIQ